MKKNILITGGAGFIGCHVVQLFVQKYPEYISSIWILLLMRVILKTLAQLKMQKTTSLKKSTFWMLKL
jgi:nucleoside-diphosphate-sugar epimerase